MFLWFTLPIIHSLHACCPAASMKHVTRIDLHIVQSIIAIVLKFIWLFQFTHSNMSEKLCLQWNEFHDNIKNVFAILREEYDFADVTLACEDGQQVEAHKVILASSSPFFKKLLGRNKQPHPIIFMRGVKYDDLVALVEFLYSGEANICQDSLDSFFAIAEELQLKGLTSNKKEKSEANNEKPETIPPAIFTRIEKETSSKRQIVERTPIALPTEVSVDLLNLEDRVMSNMKNMNNF